MGKSHSMYEAALAKMQGRFTYVHLIHEFDRVIEAMRDTFPKRDDYALWDTWSSALRKWKQEWLDPRDGQDHSNRA